MSFSHQPNDTFEVDGDDGIVIVDESFERALQYQTFKREGLNNAQIATRMGVHRTTIQRWIKEWSEDGTLQRVERVLVQPKLDKIKAAQEAVMDAWPELMRRLVAIGLNQVYVDDQHKPVSPRASIEAILTLKTLAVDPFTQSLVNVDDAAAGFADRIENNQVTNDPNAILSLRRESRPTPPKPTGNDPMPF